MSLSRRLFLLFSVLFLAGTLPAQTTFSTVVVFGDSLSDTGNVAHLTQNQYLIRYPADNQLLGFDYTDGRFTDGADTQPAAQAYFGVWVEQLAASFPAKPAVKNSLDGGTNYAYGDSTTGAGTTTEAKTFNGVPVSITLNNMGQQVSDYLGTNPTPNPNTLYVLWGGANDLYSAADNGQDPVAAAGIAVQNEIALMQQLLAKGATNFMVPNLPPLGGVPAYGGVATATALNNASGVFAQALAQGLASFQTAAAAQGITVHLYSPDILTLFTTVAGKPMAVGLSDIGTAAQNISGSPDTYLIWDGVHPTTTGHHYVAAAAENLLTPLVASTTAATVPLGALPGQTVTVSAQVTSKATTPTPTGLVTFFNGTTLLGSGALDGTATATATFTAAAAASPYSISAVYAGDTSYNVSAAAPQPLTVLTAPVMTTITLSSSNGNSDLGSYVTFTATVTPAVTTEGTPAGTVTFSDGSTTLGTGTLTGGVATFMTSLLAAGTHNITATYAANGVFGGSTSAVTTQVVVPPSVTVTVTPNPFVIQAGSSLTGAATVTSLGGYAGSFTISCGSLPAHLSCTLATATVSVSADGSQGSILTFATNAASSSAALTAPRRPGARMGAPVLSATLLFPGLAGVLLFSLRRRRSFMAAFGKSTLLLLLTAGAVFGIAGCGNNSNSNNNNAARGTYTVPITFTPDRGTAQTVNVTVIVQ